MNAKRFSKIDIGSVRRKSKPPVRIPNVIKREVMSSELMYAVSRMKESSKSLVELVKPKTTMPVRPKFNWIGLQRQMIQIGSFAITGLIIVACLQGLVYLSSAKDASGEILGAATSAYTDIVAARQNVSTQDFGAAKQLFDAAVVNINIAQEKLNNFAPLKWLAPQANSADHLLSGAGFLSEAGKKLTTALNLFDELKVSSKGVETADFNDKMSANRQLLAESRDLVVLAQSEFDSVGSLPLDYSQTLEKARQQVSELSSVLDKLIGLEDLYLGFFSGQKTYLMVFQNYDEARATGGFIGTYGVLGVNNGTITKLKIESIYQLDGQIYEQIAAPGPMQPEIKRWGIRDANWFVDFPTSAKKLLYFFEKGSATADGIISLTPKLFTDLLRLTGPIDMPEYGVVLTADNFQLLAQYKTSVDYNKTLNQPKKFLADFAPVLLDRLVNMKKDQWFQILQIFEENLQQREILLYSTDQNKQKQIQDLGFGGQVLSTNHDYLSINNTNLGGTKTDLSIAQNAELNAKILSDGSIINTLTITRKNPLDVQNKDYLRLLVPLHSQLISASGFDAYQYYDSAARGMRTDPDLAAWDIGQMHSDVYVRTEAGKTEFAGWLATQPGQERSVTLSYLLPFKINADSLNSAQPYSLLLQKQSGSKPYSFSGSLNLGQFKPEWLGPGVKSFGSDINFQSESNMDDFWPMALSK